MWHLFVRVPFLWRLANLVMIGLLIVLSGMPSIADARPRGAQSTGRPQATITSLYGNVQVNTDCSGSTCTDSQIGYTHSNRNLAIGSDGTIYTVFNVGTATYFSKSTNRGQTFSTPQLIFNASSVLSGQTAAWGRLMIDSGDVLYYMSYNERQLIKSTDGGNNWNEIGTGRGGKFAVDGSNIYMLGYDDNYDSVDNDEF